jgi:hypothetical protein
LNTGTFDKKKRKENTTKPTFGTQKSIIDHTTLTLNVVAPTIISSRFEPLTLGV